MKQQRSELSKAFEIMLRKGPDALDYDKLSRDEMIFLIRVFIKVMQASFKIDLKKENHEKN